MVYKIEHVPDIELDAIYEKSMKELNDFFGFNWTYNLPHLVMVENRKMIDKLWGKKSEPWMVGWAKSEVIYILDKKNYEAESSHIYSDEKYNALIKHELAHCFSDIISGRAQNPVWLLEGISIYLSGQIDLGTRPEKMKSFLDFHDNGGAGVYKESGFAIEFLIEKYGKEKLLEMLKKVRNANTKEDFQKLFFSIYGFDLAYENFEVLKK